MKKYRVEASSVTVEVEVEAEDWNDAAELAQQIFTEAAADYTFTVTELPAA